MSIRITDTAVIIESKPCPLCNQRSKIMLPYQGWSAWFLDGKLIHEALPDLSPGEREALMTGLCEPCWDSTFSDYEGEPA